MINKRINSHAQTYRQIPTHVYINLITFFSDIQTKSPAYCHAHPTEITIQYRLLKGHIHI